jgi:hypothetical protein
MRLMMRLKIQRVNSVPPIPTMTIVIPKVQLSMSKYLLLTKASYPKPVLYTTVERDFQQKK